MKIETEYQLEKLKLNPEDVVIVKYDIDKISIDEIKQIFINIKNALPFTPIIAIPKGITLDTNSKENILNYLKSI